MKIFYTALIVVVGFIFAFQGSINSQITSYLRHPMQGALLNFGVGFVALFALNFILRTGMPNMEVLRTAPWYLFLGGLLGAIFVTVLILCVPKIGISAALAGSIAGQLIAASVIDHYGLFGLTVRLISTGRIIGILCLLFGVYLIQRY